MVADIQTISEDLRSRDICPSIQRVRILDFLRSCSGDDYGEELNSECGDYHPSVDQIFQKLQKELPTLSKTTVYNTLRLLEEKHLVSSVQSVSGELHYDRKIQPHSHLYCESCRRIFDWDDEGLNKQSAELEESFKRVGSAKNRAVHSLQILVRGNCEDCLDQA